MVSFNIPVHNDMRFLEACLFSLASQNYPDFEIIIVFDMNTRNMNETDVKKAEIKILEFNNIFNRFRDKVSGVLSLTLIVTDPCTIGKAREIGVESAKGEIIAFIDSDCVLPTEYWLSQMAEPFTNTNVPGRYINLDENNPQNTLDRIDVVFTLGAYHKDDPPIMRYSILSNPFDPAIHPGTGHTLIRKSAIFDAGGFQDINSCEDLDLMRRIRGKMLYLPDCGVYHYYATSFHEYIWKFLKSDKNRIKANAQGNPHKRIFLLKYRIMGFTKALFGKDDRAWLLWPFADFALILIKIRNRWFI